MPIHGYIPLPGPFVWTSRRRPRMRRGMAYWLLGGWAFEATFYAIYAMGAATAWGVRYAYRWFKQQRSLKDYS